MIPILTKFEVQASGFMEAIFLDARTQRYVEEGSSCNVFFRLTDGALVTPELEDTILPGINPQQYHPVGARYGRNGNGAPAFDRRSDAGKC